MRLVKLIPRGNKPTVWALSRECQKKLESLGIYYAEVGQ